VALWEENKKKGKDIDRARDASREARMEVKVRERGRREPPTYCIAVLSRRAFLSHVSSSLPFVL